METVKEYMINSQFHGLRFITQDGRHLVERLFWLVCVVCSWCLSAQLFYNYWISYKYHPVSFVTETDYAHWKSHLFSITVCEDQNDTNIIALAKRLYGTGANVSHLEGVILEVAFFRGNGAFISKFCLEKNRTCPDKDLKEIANMARRPCSSLFANCALADEPFNCCDYFLPLETEMGICYSLNSLQTRERKPLDTGSTEVSGLRNIRLEMKASTFIYIHGPEEVPSLNSKESDVIVNSPDLYRKYAYKILETTNEPLVREVAVETRACRFHDENPLWTHRSYGQSACIIECRMNLQIKLCGCSSHLMNFTRKPCGLRGLVCLQKHLHEHFPVTATGPACKHCLPSCTEMEYEYNNHETYGGVGGLSEVELGFAHLPNVRLKRQVVRSTLDLVVSIGGSAGLFVGASMLSFVEIAYYFIIRPAGNRLQKKKEETENNNQQNSQLLYRADPEHPTFID